MPSLLVHLRVRRLPSTYTCEPLRRYSPAISASRPLKTTRCHSVASFISPLCLSFHLSVVAMVTLATRSPLGKVRISGSRPRLPTMMTLLTDAMAVFLCCLCPWADYVGTSSASTCSADRVRPGARMGQATTSHTTISAAQVANRPAIPTCLDTQPPTAPPAKKPSDWRVL